jgi:predicted nucleic acid-binding protein
VTTERRVLLDTSVIITPPSGGFASIADLVALSAITVAELEYGVEAAKDPLERQRRRRRLAELDLFEVLPFDRDAAQSYGMMANLVRNAGRDPRPRWLDLQIAATAERYGFSLATRNADDFRHLDRVLHVVQVE